MPQPKKNNTIQIENLKIISVKHVNFPLHFILITLYMYVGHCVHVLEGFGVLV